MNVEDAIDRVRDLARSDGRDISLLTRTDGGAVALVERDSGRRVVRRRIFDGADAHVAAVTGYRRFAGGVS